MRSTTLSQSVPRASTPSVAWSTVPPSWPLDPQATVAFDAVEEDMAKKLDEDLFALLRSHGLRKKVAKSIAALDGNSRRAGAEGEKLARQAVDDLNAAAEHIRKRMLRSHPNRTRGARKAAQTRTRKAAQRKASAKKGAQTRAKVARTRTKAKTGTRRG